jgi:predicted ArsR family transcriptional regulator
MQTSRYRSCGQRDRRLLRALSSRREGRVADLPELTGLDLEVVRQRLSVMRHDGSARWSDVYVPARAGRPMEALTYVKLKAPSNAQLAAFEAYCQADPAIEAAALLAGGVDYVLTGYFRDHGAARDWARQLSLRADVARVEQKIVQTRFGHPLGGVPWA